MSGVPFPTFDFDKSMIDNLGLMSHTTPPENLHRKASTLGSEQADNPEMHTIVWATWGVKHFLRFSMEYYFPITSKGFWRITTREKLWGTIIWSHLYAWILKKHFGSSYYNKHRDNMFENSTKSNFLRKLIWLVVIIETKDWGNVATIIRFWRDQTVR